MTANLKRNTVIFVRITESFPKVQHHVSSLGHDAQNTW